jgi:DnaJ like chaperone protein
LRRIATLYGVDGLEFAHIESVLRLHGTQHQRGAARANDAEALASAYRVLEVSAEASSEEIEKAYRRQLSRHHPDKLKANGLPETMLEHAKQRTQQIIEAWETIKERRGLARE